MNLKKHLIPAIIVIALLCVLGWEFTQQAKVSEKYYSISITVLDENNLALLEQTYLTNKKNLYEFLNSSDIPYTINDTLVDNQVELTMIAGLTNTTSKKIQIHSTACSLTDNQCPSIDQIIIDQDSEYIFTLQ